MFLGIATFETLNESGDLNSYIMAPSEEGSRLITDNIGDVDSTFTRSSVDVGPLRVYADEKGIAFRYISSRLGGNVFIVDGDRIRLNLEHQDVPLEPNRAGYYGILFPKNFLGQATLSIKVQGEEKASPKRVFLTDTMQMFLSSGFRVYSDQRGTTIRASADLSRGGTAGDGVETSTFAETFGGYIDGLNDTSVADLIREINRSLEPDVPQVFICHASGDKPLARRLAHALAGQGVRVWIDEAEIKTGDSLIEKIESGIFTSHNLIVILTPRSVNSRWCKEELRMALALQIKGSHIRVLPVLFEDCEIPGFLIEKAYSDFREADKFNSGVRELVAAIATGERSSFKDLLLQRWRRSES